MITPICSQSTNQGRAVHPLQSYKLHLFIAGNSSYQFLIPTQGFNRLKKTIIIKPQYDCDAIASANFSKRLLCIIILMEMLIYHMV